MQRISAFSTRSQERGQTIALVAIFITVLIGMAALAIDTTTLYVAHNETQRAANAAALAGAEAFVDSGVTTGYNSTVTADKAVLQTLAGNMATSFVNAVVAQNKVQGIVPTVVSATSDFTTHPGNPQITVTLQRTNLPTFFARIFGRTLATVRASATAEAYNSSNPNPGSTPSMPPVAASCVKPWLVPNVDFHHSGQPFVNPDGSLRNPGVWGGAANGVIGERLGGSTDILENLFLKPPPPLPPIPITLPPLLGVLNTLLRSPGYLPANVSSFRGTSSACSGGGDFGNSIAGCNTAAGYSQVYVNSCAATGANPTIDLFDAHKTDIVNGTACLIGATGGPVELGKDTIDFYTNYVPGTGPIEITAGSGPHSGFRVTTSSQIVTMPIVDTNLLSLLTGPKVVGFMQAFITSVDSADGGIGGNILNISGCGTNINTSATPISGGGVSPVPVRLIHN